jgi:hypothetical protein
MQGLCWLIYKDFEVSLDSNKPPKINSPKLSSIKKKKKEIITGS